MIGPGPGSHQLPPDVIRVMDRPRRRCKPRVEDGCVDLGEAAALVGGARHILVVSGSGISASAGLSTYVNGAGVYERAAKRYKLKRGIELFNWAFYAARPRDSQRFLAELADSARAAEPTRAHRGIVDLERRRFLARHVTLNVDGLSLAAGGSLWEGGDVGRTIELHGALRDVVDAETGAVRPLDDGALANFKARRDAFPTGVARPAGGKKRPRGVDEGGDPSPPLRFRFRVLLYGDEEHGLVLDGPAALARLDADAAAADLVLWLGISFEQAASRAAPRKNRRRAETQKKTSLARIELVRREESDRSSPLPDVSTTGERGRFTGFASEARKVSRIVRGFRAGPASICDASRPRSGPRIGTRRSSS